MTDCNGRQSSAIDVITATNTVSQRQQDILFGYEVVGAFAQSASVVAQTVAPSNDAKLWIIGAVLGPVAFVLLLIGLACFLHYKCRPRASNISTAQVCLQN